MATSVVIPAQAGEPLLVNHSRNSAPKKTISKCMLCIKHAVTEGVLLEMLISQAAIKCKVTPRPDSIPYYNATSLQHLDTTSDVLWYINIIKKWSHEVRKGTSASWCYENNISETVLKLVEKTVEEMFVDLKQRCKCSLQLRFHRYPTTANKIVADIFKKVYKDHICVYAGHPKLGYKSVSDGKTLAISNGTLLHVLMTKPDFILCLQHDDDKVITSALVLSQDEASNILKTDFGLTQKQIIQDYQTAPTEITCVSPCVQKLLMDWWMNCELCEEDNLQKQLCNICQGNECVLEVDSDKCMVSVYCLEVYAEAVKQAMENHIEKARNIIRNETVTLAYPHPSSLSKFIFGPGFQVLDTLYSGESFIIALRSFSMLDPSSEASTMVKKYPGSHLRMASSVERKKGIWGFLVCSTSADALSVMENEVPEMFTMELQQNTLNICSQKPIHIQQYVKYYSKKYPVPDVRPEPGNGQITAKGDTVKGTSNGNKNKKKKQKKVTAKIQSEKKAGPSPIAALITRVHRGLQSKLSYSTNGKFDLNMQVDDNGKYPEISFSVLFPDYRTSKMGVECLIGQKVAGHLISPPEDADVVNLGTFSIELVPQAYRVCRNMIFQKLENLKSEFGLTSVEKISQSLCVVDITTSKVHHIDRIADAFNSMLLPFELKLSTSEKEFCKHSKGSMLIAFVEQFYNCFIDIEKFAVYGSKSAKLKGSEALMEFIKDQRDTISEPTLFIIEYKDKMEQEIPVLFHNAKSHRMEILCWNSDKKFIIIKTLEAFEEPRDIFGMLMPVSEDYILECLGFHENQVKAQPPIMMTCSTCYCEASQWYVLEGCGHIYCLDCFKTQIDVAVKNNQLPLQCASDGVPFTYSDYINGSSKGIHKQKKIIKAAIRTFLSANATTRKCCPKVNCNGIVKIDVLKGQPLICFLCRYAICPNCYSCYHKGFTCEEYESNVKLIEVWMKEDEKNRKECPRCGIGIEKNGGCNKVTCTNCDFSICWICCKFFNRPADCYDHLNSEHGNYY